MRSVSRAQCSIELVGPVYAFADLGPSSDPVPPEQSHATLRTRKSGTGTAAVPSDQILYILISSRFCIDGLAYWLIAH